MASHSEPRLKTFRADADLSSYQYHFVKWGTDYQHVALCGANEKSCGILMNKPSAAEQSAVVAVPGGGAKLVISETVTVGQYLTSTSAGHGEVADAADEEVGAQCYDPGSANDVVAVEVMHFPIHASDA